jgi:hypothetical protein
MIPKSPREKIDLSHAVVLVSPERGKQEQKAATVLVEEIQKRTNIRWQIVAEMPQEGVPTIILGQVDILSTWFVEDKNLLIWANNGSTHQPEGFQIQCVSDIDTTKIYLLGNDKRGVLFAVGYLLRHLSMAIGSVSLKKTLNINTAPRYTLRGHQLGYRDKTNSYDGWDLVQWDQYIRELAVFGTNAIELIPPRSDDKEDGVHFPLPPMDMMEGMSAIADDYGLDVWIWYPAMDDDYSRPEVVDFALNEWENIYKRLPRIDAILVPGGDPGNTRPKYLLPMLAKQTGLLKKYHPKAQMWVSAQGLNREWMQEFVTILREESPDWLSGVVYGPWIHMPIHEFRQLIPQKYPIRSYPDITHSLDCQYPIPEWDIAYALTEGRETINPRPRSETVIFQQMGDDVIGFLTYSEGCNDDVNKFIWSGLGWDPLEDVAEILQQYSRFFIGELLSFDFTRGILALERNWVGPLIANEEICITLMQFQDMEKRAAPRDLKNWRFQQALYRAYYDAYTQSRLRYEIGLEEQAMVWLRQAEKLGSWLAMQEAENILDRAVLYPVNVQWRTRIFQLAEALFQSIHMQLSVPLYAAQSETRGANLDGLDYPLNDRPWLMDRFTSIHAMTDEEMRIEQIHKILDWRNPGPGGYYIDFSNAYDCQYIVKGLPYEEDPAFYFSPHRRFPYWKDPRPFRRSWRGYIGALNDSPFKLHFPYLEPSARYKVRVIYSDTENEVKIRLVANNDIVIHPFLIKPNPPAPLEFDIPWDATRTGKLNLALSREEGLGGLGAGHEICEIWIIRNSYKR